jgi:GntR family transcriptional regulator, arabinose operon transcriptional repressor
MTEKETSRLGRPISNCSRYRQIADDLKRRIASGEWPVNTALPALRRLAADYKTGQHTVRSAVEILKREGLVRIGMSRRLLISATGKMQGPLDGALLLMSSLPMESIHSGGYYSELLRGIEIGAGELSAPLLIPHGGQFHRHPQESLFTMPLRGIVLLGVFTETILRRYTRLPFPVVLADQPAGEVSLHSVTNDNRPAAKLATEMLIKAGHRRILFLRSLQLNSGRVDPDSQERQQGFLEALKEAGIPRRDCHVINALPGDSASSPSMRTINNRNSPYTGVLASSGSLAQLVKDTARERGKVLPRDLSIVCLQGMHSGFDNFSGPRINFLEIGRRAANLITQPKKPTQHLHVSCGWRDCDSLTAVRSTPG